MNNAIKHSQHVDDELTRFPRWRSKQGRKLGNLEAHYSRLRSAAEQYLTDLADRLSRGVEGRIIGPDVGAADGNRGDEVPVDGVAEGFVDANTLHVDREPLRGAL